jgi:inner membrane protein
MDTLTHALSGALLARATAPVKPVPGALTSGARMTVGFLAAAFPDSDFVLRLFDTLTYVTLHRGVTHSILLLPGWALLLAWLLSFLSRRRYSWRAIYGTAALGIAIHIAGDVITSYGTMVLAPFSRQAFAVPFTFIIDSYFTAIIATGLVAGRFKPGRRYPAVLSLVVLVCYVGFQGVLHSDAIKIGEAYRENKRLINAQVHAFPQPLSPFNWKIIVSHKDEYEVALVNLRRALNYTPAKPASGILGMWGRIDAGYQSPAAAAWARYKQFGDNPSRAVLARQAWNQEVFARFRGFASFPVLDQVEFAGNAVCVSFFDLRFTVPSLPPSLVFGVCRDSPRGPWRLKQDPGLFGRD